MDIIIQEYLKDPKIPFQNRKNLALDLDTQRINEKSALEVLNTKYPNRYGIPKIQPAESVQSIGQPIEQPQQPQQPVESTQRNFSPLGANMGAIMSKAPQVINTLGDYVTRFNPVMPKPFHQDVDKVVEKKADEIAKKYGWTEHTKQAFLNMDRTQQARMLEASGQDTIGAQILNTGKEAVGTLANAMYSYTAKPVIEQGITVGKGVQAFGAATPHILKGDYDTALKVFDETAGQPVNMLGDNYNLASSAYDPETKTLDESKLRPLFEGGQLKSTGGALNTVSFGAPAMAGSFWYNALAGATLGAGESRQKGESIPATLVNGLARGALQGTMAKIFSYANNKSKMDPTQKALFKKNVDEQARNVFKDPKNQKIVTSYLDDAMEKVRDVKSPGAWKQPIREMNQYLDDLQKVGKTLGEKVSTTKETLKGIKVDPTPVKKAIESFIRSKGATIKGKNIVWKGSDLGGAPKTALNMMDDIYKLSQKKIVDARKLESMTSQIETIIGYAKQAGLKTSKIKPELGHIKSTINKLLEKHSKEFGKANKDFAVWINGYNKIKKAMKVGSGNNVSYDPQNMLSKSLIRGGSKKYEGVFEKINELAQRFNLKAPQDIQDKAWIAYWAENATKTAPARASENVIGKAIPNRYVRAAANTVQAVKKSAGLGDMTPIQTYATSLKSILEKGIKSGGKIPHKMLYDALKIVANLERVTQTPPQVDTNIYGDNSPESYIYEKPYIAEEYTGLSTPDNNQYVTEEYTGL